ncbi:DUF7196 family protein [Nocardia asiatica]|uniref:DUF7196 family protein n=1 Tax=Nocardia asiatica TaxID=209252 RepID=UPI0024585D5E|nr:hypothetical protein [Nocardia asiatica]
MGSCCGGSRAPKAGKVTGYEVITYTGEKFGPFLTSTEANIKVMEMGGGVIKPVREAT